MTSPRLLLISCSQRKLPNSDLLPAIQRYDGPPFRVLRRFLQTTSSNLPDIYILSARFGLISSDHFIADYNQRMTIYRAQELHSSVLSMLTQIFHVCVYQEICICLGQDYLQAIDGYKTLLPSVVDVNIITGSQGEKLAKLHTWLYKEK